MEVYVSICLNWVSILNDCSKFNSLKNLVFKSVTEIKNSGIYTALKVLNSFASPCKLIACNYIQSFSMNSQRPFTRAWKSDHETDLVFSVVNADALRGKIPLRGKMKFASLKSDFFIYPANCVPRIVIFCWEILIAEIISSYVPAIFFDTLN